LERINTRVRDLCDVAAQELLGICPVTVLAEGPHKDIPDSLGSSRIECSNK
jgi:hypothetical protein